MIILFFPGKIFLLQLPQKYDIENTEFQISLILTRKSKLGQKNAFGTLLLVYVLIFQGFDSGSSDMSIYASPLQSSLSSLWFEVLVFSKIFIQRLQETHLKQLRRFPFSICVLWDLFVGNTCWSKYRRIFSKY